jgi:hypothetical protein
LSSFLKFLLKLFKMSSEVDKYNLENIEQLIELGKQILAQDKMKARIVCSLLFLALFQNKTKIMEMKFKVFS